MHYIPSHFEPFELVPNIIYNILKDQSYYLFDYRVLITADQLRVYFDTKVIINNWTWGGNFSNRGFRLESCTIGAKNSMHKKGGALDMDFENIDAGTIRAEVLRHSRMFPFIKRIEGHTNWFHFDIKETGKDDIVIFNP